MAIYRNRAKEEIFLGEKLGFGGEADVYYLKDDESQVAKIYNDEHTINPKKHQKLKLMCDLYDDKIAQYYAWPKDIIYSNRKPVGIIMNNINEIDSDSKYIKLINFYSLGAREQYFPNTEYKYMVHSALNFACAVDTLHQKEIVIGDINESNIFVNDENATIKLLDCDSYQIEDFSADVGKPEFIAPELPDTLRGVIRTQNHDNFAVAIVIFLILVGRHPYQGIGAPLFREAIKNNLYCYGKYSKNKGVSAPSPYDEIYNLLNDEIKDLFEKAFNSTNRPTASDWIKALKKFENQLVECDYDRKHWFNPENKTCIWCDLEEAGLPFFGNTQVQTHNQIPYQSQPVNNNYQQQIQAGVGQSSNYTTFGFSKFFKDLFKGIGWGAVYTIVFPFVLLGTLFGGFKKFSKAISSILVFAFLLGSGFIKHYFDKNLEQINSNKKQEIIVDKNKPQEIKTQTQTTQEENIEPQKNDNNNASKETWDLYMRQIDRRIKMNWKPLYYGVSNKIITQFTIAKDGRLLESKIIQSSGNSAEDKAALEAIKNSAPFNPLPPEYKGESVPVEFTFEYNLKR